MGCDYVLDPRKNFYESLLDVFKMKMIEEKNKFEYINPNGMSEILKIIETYGHMEVDDEFWDWVSDMYGA